ncbi:hypothetical protein ACJJIP_08370 [Microbulbifer sp. VTAC004]|uniref:hypothetical protein n=1 Tax=Microbulbifer sp. VTAC004 TaxID=3243386 RepID=UPI0040394C77
MSSVIPTDYEFGQAQNDPQWLISLLRQDEEINFHLNSLANFLIQNETQINDIYNFVGSTVHSEKSKEVQEAILNLLRDPGDANLKIVKDAVFEVNNQFPLIVDQLISKLKYDENLGINVNSGIWFPPQAVGFGFDAGAELWGITVNGKKLSEWAGAEFVGVPSSDAAVVQQGFQTMYDFFRLTNSRRSGDYLGAKLTCGLTLWNNIPRTTTKKKNPNPPPQTLPGTYHGVDIFSTFFPISVQEPKRMGIGLELLGWTFPDPDTPSQLVQDLTIDWENDDVQKSHSKFLIALKTLFVLFHGIRFSANLDYNYGRFILEIIYVLAEAAKGKKPSEFMIKFINAFPNSDTWLNQQQWVEGMKQSKPRLTVDPIKVYLEDKSTALTYTVTWPSIGSIIAGKTFYNNHPVKQINGPDENVTTQVKLEIPLFYQNCVVPGTLNNMSKNGAYIEILNPGNDEQQQYDLTINTPNGTMTNLPSYPWKYIWDGSGQASSGNVIVLEYVGQDNASWINDYVIRINNLWPNANTKTGTAAAQLNFSDLGYGADTTWTKPLSLNTKTITLDSQEYKASFDLTIDFDASGNDGQNGLMWKFWWLYDSETDPVRVTFTNNQFSFNAIPCSTACAPYIKAPAAYVIRNPKLADTDGNQPYLVAQYYENDGSGNYVPMATYPIGYTFNEANSNGTYVGQIQAGYWKNTGPQKTPQWQGPVTISTNQPKSIKVVFAPTRSNTQFATFNFNSILSEPESTVACFPPESS